ncbi:MAG: hypothetical protein WD004_03590 [Actinomycetota bacterium]
MKKVLIVTLVVLLVVLAVPILIPGMSMCPDCDLGVMGGMGLCFTLVAFGLLMVTTTSERLATASSQRVSLLRSRRLHRPPRFA